MTAAVESVGRRQGAQTHKSAGHVIVDSLVAHGIKRAHVVPGESFLDVLDGLHGSPIETIVCRHEGGATYMAEADGKMNQMPGIAMVTRGPGAANAHVGLHTAWQDSTPMVLFVGLIPFAHRDREAFQEFDIKAWFDTGAKRVMVLDHAERASEIVAEALFAAMSGRPGPVVIGLPEDVIRQQIPADCIPRSRSPAPSWVQSLPPVTNSGLLDAARASARAAESTVVIPPVHSAISGHSLEKVIDFNLTTFRCSARRPAPGPVLDPT